MKYIRTSNYEIILFQDSISHDVFKNRFDIVSAGYVDFNTNKYGVIPKVYGFSHSLNLEPLADDEMLIKTMIDTKKEYMI